MRLRVPLVLALLLIAAPSFAVSIWNEAVDGDLSGDRDRVTNLPLLVAGTNSVTATTVAGDFDFFLVELPDGLVLSSIVLASYESLSDLSFLAVQEDDIFVIDPAAPDASQLLGWAHFGGSDVGTDLLGTMAVAPGAQGFSPPLAGGPELAFWLNETGPSPATYTLDFVVTPEPASALLVATGLAGLAAVRSRRASAAEAWHRKRRAPRCRRR